MDQLGKRSPDDPGPSQIEAGTVTPETQTVQPLIGMAANIYRDLRDVVNRFPEGAAPQYINANNPDTKRGFTADFPSPAEVRVRQTRPESGWSVIANGTLDVHFEGPVVVHINDLMEATRGNVTDQLAALGITREGALQMLAEIYDGAMTVNSKARNPKYQNA